MDTKVSDPRRARVIKRLESIPTVNSKSKEAPTSASLDPRRARVLERLSSVETITPETQTERLSKVSQTPKMIDTRKELQKYFYNPVFKQNNDTSRRSLVSQSNTPDMSKMPKLATTLPDFEVNKELSERKNALENPTYSTTAEELDRVIADTNKKITSVFSAWTTPDKVSDARLSVEKTYSDIVNYFNTQRPNMTQEQAGEVMKIFMTYKDMLDKLDDLESSYGAYKTEKDYNDAVRKIEGLYTLDLTAAKAEIEDLEKRVAAYQPLYNKLYQKKGLTAEEQAQALSLFGEYGSYTELQKALGEKTAYYNQASYRQEGASLGDVGKEDTKHYDPEYLDYVAKGKAIPYSEIGKRNISSIGQYGGAGQTEIDNLRAAALALAEHNGVDVENDTRTLDSQSEKRLNFYRDLTEEEFDTLAYHLARDRENGTDNAERYLFTIEENIHSRRAEKIAKELEGKTFQSILYAGKAGISQFGTNIKNLIEQKDGYIPLNTTQQASGMVRENLKDVSAPIWYNFKTGEWEDTISGASLGQLTYDAVNTTANMLPSILTAKVANLILPGSGATVGSTLIGMSSAGGAYQEMINLGYSKGQANAYALMTGASEALLERAIGGFSDISGLSKTLKTFAKGVDNATARLAIQLGGSMAGEFLEEATQEAISPFLQNWALTYSKNDWDDVKWGEVLYSGILGALSSLGHEAVPQTVSTVAEAKKNKTTAPDLPNGVESTTQNAPSVELSAEQKNTVENGDATKVMVVDSGISAINEKNKENNSLSYILATNTDKIKNMEAVTTLTGAEFNNREISLPEQIRGFFKSIGNKVFRKNFGDVEFGEYGVGGVMNHRPLNRAKLVSLAAAPSVISQGKQISYTPNWKGRGYESFVFAAPIKINDSTVYVAAVVDKRPNNKFYLSEMIDSNGNYVRIETSPADTSKSGVTNGGTNIAKVGITAEPTGLSGEDSLSVQSTEPMSSSDTIVSQPEAEVKPFTPRPNPTPNSELVVMAPRAFEKGPVLPTAEEIARERRAGKAETELEASAIRFGVSEEITKEALEISQGLQRNIKFVYSDDVGDEGWYDEDTDTICINVNAKTFGTGFIGVVVHEITHSIENAPGYYELYSGVISLKQRHAEAFKAEQNKWIERYHKRGRELTPDGANREIVADWVRTHLFKDKSSIQDVAQKNHNFAIWIYGKIEKLGGVLGLNSAREKAFLNRARHLWLQAIENANRQSRIDNAFEEEIYSLDVDAVEGDVVQHSYADYPIDPEVEQDVKKAFANTKGEMHALSIITPTQDRIINNLATGNDLYKGKYKGGVHKFSNHAIKHVMAEHGDFLREGLRAQLPMTLEDISRHLSALKNDKYPSTVKASRTKQGQPSIITSYAVNGYTLYAEEIKESLGNNTPSDLIGHTMYKAPTLSTAAFYATSAQTQPKRQSMVLCSYYIPNSTDLSTGNFISDKNGNPTPLNYIIENGTAKQNENLSGLIAMSSDSSNFTDKSHSVGQGYVVCKKPYYITQNNKVFSNSETNVAEEINKLKKQGYDCFIFDKVTGDNYMVAVVNKAQIVKEKPVEVANNSPHSYTDVYEEISEESASPVISSSPKVVQSFISRVENDTSHKLKYYLPVSYSMLDRVMSKPLRTISEELMKTGDVSRPAIERAFEEIYENSLEESYDYVTRYTDVNKAVSKLVIKLSPREYEVFEEKLRKVRRLLPDKTVRFSKTEGVSLDEAWEELNKLSPELFPKFVEKIAPRISRILNHVIDYSGAVSCTVNPDEQTKRWKLADFERAVSDMVVKLRSQALRYVNAPEHQKNPTQAFLPNDEAVDTSPISIPQTPEEASELFKKRDAVVKKRAKVRSQYIFTKSDQRQILRIMNGDIELSDLVSKRDNVEGITAVIPLEREYERYSEAIRAFHTALRKSIDDRSDYFLRFIGSRDKKMPFNYTRETAERNFKFLIPDADGANKELCEDVLNYYVRSVSRSEAEKNRYAASLFDRVKALDLSRRVVSGNLHSESAIVQMYGEAQDNLMYLASREIETERREGKTAQEWEEYIEKLFLDNPNVDRARIENAVKVFRGIYDELFKKLNEALVRNGYEPIQYRHGYFPHFKAEEDNALTYIASKLGIDAGLDLPAAINGLTQNFRPGKSWFGNAESRHGTDTAYDALEGFEKYFNGAANVIYQTDNIQRLRSLARRIRYNASDAGIQEKIDAIIADRTKTQDQKDEEIRVLTDNAKYTLSNFVVWLDEYTNLLAGKKSKYDRLIEGELGRRGIYGVLKKLYQTTGANMVIGNLASAMTNFVPIVDSFAMTGTVNTIRATYDTLKNLKVQDGLMSLSDFYTNRTSSNKLVMTPLEKSADAAGFAMNVVDSLATEVIIRSRYYQNLKDGMSEELALREADTFAERIMAGRSKGEMPNAFHAQSLKVLTQFQLEVANQFSVLFSDMPSEIRKRGVAYGVGLALRLVIGTALLNGLLERLLGRRVKLDPIDILNEFIGDVAGKKLADPVEELFDLIWRGDPFEIIRDVEKENAWKAIEDLSMSILKETPFLGTFFGGGRLPIANSLPGIFSEAGDLFSAMSNENTTPTQKAEKAGEFIVPKVATGLLPFGYNQISKSAKGIEAVRAGGKFKTNNSGEVILQYPYYSDEGIKSVGNALRAIIFGTSSLPEAREWVERDFVSFNPKETQGYLDAVATGESQRGVFETMMAVKTAGALSSDGKVKRPDKFRVLTESDISDEAKYAIYKNALATEEELERIQKMFDNGVSEKAVMKYALNFVTAEREFDEKENSYESISRLEQWGFALDATKSEKERLALLKELTSETQYANFELLYEYDVPLDAFITLKEKLPEYDENKNESYSGQEIKGAINALFTTVNHRLSVASGKTTQLTREDKAVLWQLATGSTSPSSNPYGNYQTAKRIVEYKKEIKEAE